VDIILVGQKISGDEPKITRCSRMAGLVCLFQTMAIGVGVPQMAEHMLRGNAALARIFLSRLREAWRTARASEVYRFQVVADAHKNAAALDRFAGALR
jgi:hypothetical protein